MEIQVDGVLMALTRVQPNMYEILHHPAPRS